jgi:hypothetical protein
MTSVFLVLCLLLGAVSAQDKPNIIMVLIDDYGNGIVVDSSAGFLHHFRFRIFQFVFDGYTAHQP